jgi:mannose-6-phosphate isomerase-like protein (cupin superfamily)
MTLQPNEDIGEEIHTDTDQFFRFESGAGKAIIDGNEYTLDAGTAIIVPAGAKHNIINISSSEVLQMYTLYSPAHHQEGTLRNTKAEAEDNAPEFD